MAGVIDQFVFNVNGVACDTNNNKLHNGKKHHNQQKIKDTIA
jgi:hypothetical protein